MGQIPLGGAGVFHGLKRGIFGRERSGQRRRTLADLEQKRLHGTQFICLEIQGFGYFLSLRALSGVNSELRQRRTQLPARPSR